MDALLMVVILTTLCACSCTNEKWNTVKTTQVGKFICSTYNVTSIINNETRPVSRCLGIPYAKPPVGDLRFAKPVPYGTVEPGYNATYYRPHCVQTRYSYRYIREHDYIQSEDCLYLNIHKPERNIYSSKLPVMAYIHGGGFGAGGADIYDGDRLSAFHDVVIVVINYRLNIFGFLSDGSTMTGNYGLWDMKLALQWVHDYIADFNGDNMAVTIFGNSAGGAAVLYQATQPSNKGLFQRVISQSGSFMALWAYKKKNPQNIFKETVQRLQCDRPTLPETMKCLRVLPTEDLKTEHWSYFLPTVDGEFIQQSPLELINPITESAKQAIEFLTSLDLLIGSTDQDGALNYEHFYEVLDIDNLKMSDISKEYIRDILARRWTHILCNNFAPIDMSSSIMDIYFLTDEFNDVEALLGWFIEIDTDVEMFVPAVLTANLFSQRAKYDNSRNNIYMYMFSQKPDFSPYPTDVTGARHFMEVPYIFGLSSSFKEKLNLDYGASYPNRISYKDVKLAETMMKFWSNFALTGNPNSGDSMDGNNVLTTFWPRYEESLYLYLDIRHDNTSVRSLNDYPASARVENVSVILQNVDKMCAYNSYQQSTAMTLSVLPCIVMSFHLLF